MKHYHSIIILLLLIQWFSYNDANFESIFSRETTIAHPEIGLFLDHIGTYTPSENIIHNSAIFPMTTATCYFLPLSAAEKIPSCNVTSRRQKRLIPALIGIGAGLFFIGMSVSNLIQASNLQKQVTIVENTLTQFSNTVHLHGAHLARLNSNDIKIGEQLQVLQSSLEIMIPYIKAHSNAINNIIGGIEHLYSQLRHAFLYSSIRHILQNELNLDFLQSDDLQKVVYDVVERRNLRFNSNHGLIPLVHIITKLLVRQQIDFVPRAQYTTDNPIEIGRLIITNFFAVPHPQQTPFHIYKLLSVPFFHNNKTIQLSAIPKYWGIDHRNNDTMEWYQPGEFGCDLQSMTSCRDTPPIRKLSNNTCFDQIIGNHPRSECYTVLAPIFSSFQYQLRDNIWITSSREPLHCIEMPKSAYAITEQQRWNLNKHILLPPVALVNITPGYTIACPSFTLVGKPVISNTSSLKIIYNDRLFTKKFSIMDIYEHLSKNSAWFDRKPLKLDIDHITNHSQEQLDTSNNQKFHHLNSWIISMLVFSWVLFGIVVSLVFYMRKHKRNNISIA